MTELIWDGKYDAHHKKQGPVRIALPFQTIETVNESAQDRRRNLELFATAATPNGATALSGATKNTSFLPSSPNSPARSTSSTSTRPLEQGPTLAS